MFVRSCPLAPRLRMPIVMTLCEQCTELVEHPVQAPPHQALVRLSAVARDDGVWETYTCESCGARAARVVPRTPMPQAKWYVRPA